MRWFLFEDYHLIHCDDQIVDGQGRIFSRDSCINDLIRCYDGIMVGCLVKLFKFKMRPQRISDGYIMLRSDSDKNTMYSERKIYAGELATVLEIHSEAVKVLTSTGQTGWIDMKWLRTV